MHWMLMVRTLVGETEAVREHLERELDNHVRRIQWYKPALGRTGGRYG